MEVLTLPKAGVALQQPHIPVLTPSLLPRAGIMQHLRELTHGGAPVCSLALFSSASLQGRDLAGGFGSLAARGETKRAAISAERRGLSGWWPPSPAGPCFKHSAGFMVGLRRKGSYSHRPRAGLISRWKCHSLILWWFLRRCLHQRDAVVWFPSVISCWKEGFGVVCLCSEEQLLCEVHVGMDSSSWVKPGWYTAAGSLLSPALP